MSNQQKLKNQTFNFRTVDKRYLSLSDRIEREKSNNRGTSVFHEYHYDVVHPDGRVEKVCAQFNPPVWTAKALHQKCDYTTKKPVEGVYNVFHTLNPNDQNDVEYKAFLDYLRELMIEETIRKGLLIGSNRKPQTSREVVGETIRPFYNTGIGKDGKEYDYVTIELSRDTFIYKLVPLLDSNKQPVRGPDGKALIIREQVKDPREIDQILNIENFQPFSFQVTQKFQLSLTAKPSVSKMTSSLIILEKVNIERKHAFVDVQERYGIDSDKFVQTSYATAGLTPDNGSRMMNTTILPDSSEGITSVLPGRTSPNSNPVSILPGRTSPNSSNSPASILPGRSSSSNQRTSILPNRASPGPNQSRAPLRSITEVMGNREMPNRN